MISHKFVIFDFEAATKTSERAVAQSTMNLAKICFLLSWIEHSHTKIPFLAIFFFRSFSVEMNHKKICETLACKYRKNREDNKFNKILDL